MSDAPAGPGPGHRRADETMKMAELMDAVRAGPVLGPGPTLADDAVYIAGRLAEEGVTGLVIAREGGSSGGAGAITVVRELLPRQTDLPGELAALADGLCMIAGPMKVCRSAGRLWIGLSGDPWPVGV